MARPLALKLFESLPEARAVLELLKPITWFPPMWAFGCGVVCASRVGAIAWWQVALGVLLTGPLVCGSSQAVNDWFDREVDALSGLIRARQMMTVDEMRRGIEGIERFMIEERDDPRGVGAPAGPSRRLEACQSPVWDTALAMVALADAGGNRAAGERPHGRKPGDRLEQLEHDGGRRDVGAPYGFSRSRQGTSPIRFDRSRPRRVRRDRSGAASHTSSGG